MFGALNRFISRLDSDPSSQNSRDGRNSFGFQVLRNKNADIPIEPWFDFVIGINGRPVESPESSLFATEIRNCAGANVALTLYSAKGQRTRTLTLPVPTPSPTLGLTLQWTSLTSIEDIWHILEIVPNSPADTAGLLPHSDYIIGTPEGNVHGEAGLGELVEDYLSRSLRLYVYNHEYDVTRLVTITPSRSWGGNGALGCVLGFGALHRLPPPLTEPPAGPGETLFETARFSNETRSSSASLASPAMGSGGFYQTPANARSGDFLVPASITSPPPSMGNPSTPAGPPRGGRKARKGVSPNSAFEEYFKEGEQKSKEEDFAPAGKAVAPPPPAKGGAVEPPKVTEPPSEGDDGDGGGGEGNGGGGGKE